MSAIWLDEMRDGLASETVSIDTIIEQSYPGWVFANYASFEYLIYPGKDSDNGPSQREWLERTERTAEEPPADAPRGEAG